MKKSLFVLTLFLMSVTAWSQSDSKFVSGTVYDSYKRPLPKVAITIFGTERQIHSDSLGEYSLYAKTSDTLVFTHAEHFMSMAVVDNSNAINVYLKSNENKRDEEIEAPLGLKANPNSVTYTSKTVRPDLLLIGRNPNAIQALDGKVSGLTVTHPDYSGFSGGRVAPNEIILRGRRSLKGSDAALVVIDGVPSNYQAFEDLNDNLIESITILKGANGAALYGSQGGNGAVIVKTKKNYINNDKNNQLSQKAQFSDNEFRYTKRLKVNLKQEIPDYIKEFNAANNEADAFKIYNNEKPNYLNNATYFIDAFAYFEKNETYSLAVFNDVLALENNRESALKGLIFKLEQLKNNNLAEAAYSTLIEENGNNAIEYRGLANVFIEKGDNQVAFNTFNFLSDSDLMITKGINNAEEVNPIILNELNNLVQTSDDINLEELEGYKIIKTVYDLRIVVESNHEDVNLNVSIINPYLEICSANNPLTGIGGEIIDAKSLYEYTLRNARKGAYYIAVDNSNNPSELVTFVKLSIYKNYGKPDVSSEVKLLRLVSNKKEQLIYQVDY